MATKKSMRKMKASALVFDVTLYPRSTIDGTHVSALVRALEGGEVLPPIHIDQNRRIIDGVHRWKAYQRRYGVAEAELVCEVHKYSSDSEAYIDALRRNSRHGKVITNSDLTFAIIKATEYDVTLEVIAKAIGVTVERVKTVTATKVLTIRGPGVVGEPKIPLKRSVRHLASLGGTITEEQGVVIGRAPGQSQDLLIRQVCDLMESDLIDWADESVATQLKRLLKLTTTIQARLQDVAI